MRPHFEQRLRNFFHARNVRHRQALEQVSVVHFALVNVRERKKRESYAAGAHVKALEGSLDVGREVGVREHDAFGFAGGARSVDDGSEQIRAQSGNPPAIGFDFAISGAGDDCFVRERVTRTAATGAAAIRRGPRRPSRCRSGINGFLHGADGGSNFRPAPELLFPRDEDHLGLRMSEDVGHAFGRFTEVNGHDHGAEAKHGKIGDVPLGAVRREKRYAIALRDPKLCQLAGKTGDAPQHFGRRNGQPLAALFVKLGAGRGVAFGGFQQAPRQGGIFGGHRPELYSSGLVAATRKPEGKSLGMTAGGDT